MKNWISVVSGIVLMGLTWPVAAQQQEDQVDSGSTGECRQFVPVATDAADQQERAARRVMACLLARQERELANARETLGALDSTSGALLDVARDLAVAAAEIVAAGIPLDGLELDQEVATLSQRLDSPVGTTSEKIAELVDFLDSFYQIGNQIFEFEDNIVVDGEALDVEVLRIGHVGLYFSTTDKRRAGFWNNERRAWVEASSKARKEIVTGLGIAQKTKDVRLLMLPISAPVAVKRTTTTLPEAEPVLIAFDISAGVAAIDGADFETAEQSIQSLRVRFEEGERELDQLRELMLQGLKELALLSGRVTYVLQAYVDDSVRSLTHIHTHENIQWAKGAAGSIKVRTGQFVSPGQLQRLGQSLLQEVGAAGQVARFRYPVQQANGEVAQTTVVRVGMFNIVSDGHFLAYDPATRVLRELKKQPDIRGYLRSTSALLNAREGAVLFALDMSQNRILEAYEKRPSLW